MAPESPSKKPKWSERFPAYRIPLNNKKNKPLNSTVQHTIETVTSQDLKPINAAALQEDKSQDKSDSLKSKINVDLKYDAYKDSECKLKVEVNLVQKEPVKHTTDDHKSSSKAPRRKRWAYQDEQS